MTGKRIDGMNNIIVYGIASMKKRTEIEFLLDDAYKIVAYVDPGYCFSHFGGIPLVDLSEVKKLDFKYIVVHEEEKCDYLRIRSLLLANGVPEEKIVWHYLFTFRNRHINYYLDDFFKKSEIKFDGLVLGNSYALRGICTSMLSKKFCNLGWHGIDLYYILRLLQFFQKECVSKLKAVRYAVLVFPYYFFNYDMSLSAWQLETGQYWALDHLQDHHHFEQLDVFKEYLRLYSINKELFSKNMNHHSLAAWGIEDDKCFHSEVWDEKMSHVWTPHDDTVREYKEIFAELLQFLYDNHIKPCILVMPYHRVIREKYSGNILAMKKMFYNIVEECQMQETVPILDLFCHAVTYEDKFWADATHLNSVGAAAVTGVLEEELKQKLYD